MKNLIIAGVILLVFWLGLLVGNMKAETNEFNQQYYNEWLEALRDADYQAFWSGYYNGQVAYYYGQVDEITVANIARHEEAHGKDYGQYIATKAHQLLRDCLERRNANQ